MKEMKRIASLMLAVALLFTCTLPAFADNGVSNGVTIANFVSAAEDSQNAALEDLITSVTIVNEKNQTIDPNGTVHVGESYEFHIRFEEKGEHAAFELENGMLRYKLPENVKFESRDSYPIFKGTVAIGECKITDDGYLEFTPYYTTDKGETWNKKTGADKEFSYVDYYGNASLKFIVKGKFETQSENTEIKFNDKVSVNVKIDAPDIKPKVNVTKKAEETQIDEDGRYIQYTVQATVTEKDVDKLTITDQMNGDLGWMNDLGDDFKVEIKKSNADSPEAQPELLEGITPKLNEKKNGFSVELTDVKAGDQYTLTYRVPIKKEYLDQKFGRVQIGNNEVKAEADGETDVDWSSVTVNGNYPLGKQLLGRDAQAGEMTWMLTIGNGQEKLKNPTTITDTWKLPDGTAATMVLEDADVIVKLYDEKGEEISSYKDAEARALLQQLSDNNGFYFTVPSGNGKDVYKCTVQYKTKVERNGQSGDINVTNTATDGSNSAEAGGTINETTPPLPPAGISKEISNETDSDYEFTLDFFIPKEYIGKRIAIEDEVYIKNEWANSNAVYNDMRIESVVAKAADGHGQKVEFQEEGKGGAYTYQLSFGDSGVDEANKRVIHLKCGKDGKRDIWKWGEPTDEPTDVNLTIVYRLPKKALVSSGAGNKKYPDDYTKGTLADVASGRLLNTAALMLGDSSVNASAEQNITKKIYKRGEVIDARNGIIEYTVMANETGNAPLDGSDFIDHYDKALSYVDGSLKVQIGYRRWGAFQGNYKYNVTPTNNEQAGTLTFSYNGALNTLKNWIITSSNVSLAFTSDDLNQENWYSKTYNDSESGKVTLGMKITYRLRINPDRMTPGENLSLANTARIGGYPEVSADVSYTPSYLAKNVTNQSGSVISYEILVNELGATFGKPLQLVDTMENLIPMTDTIQVFERDENGNWNKIADGWRYTHEQVDDTHYKLDFTLPDSKKLKITYRAYAQWQAEKQITGKNTAELIATKTVEETSTSTKVEAASGEAGGYTVAVNIKKVDAQQQTKALRGAEFSIQQYDPIQKEWKPFAENVVTDDAGLLLVSHGNAKDSMNKPIYEDCLYKLVETKAPDGYQLDQTPRYFCFLKGKTGEEIKKEYGLEQAAEISELNMSRTLVVENREQEKAFPFSLTKTDPSGQALPGATFTLTGEGYTQTATSDENGTVTFTDLNPGKSYRLEETRAPDGYLLSTETWTIEVGENGGMTVTDGSGKTVEKPESGYRFANREIPTLPSVGGRGTAGYGLLGLALMAMATAAAYTLARRKKASGAE